MHRTGDDIQDAGYNLKTVIAGTWEEQPVSSASTTGRSTSSRTITFYWAGVYRNGVNRKKSGSKWKVTKQRDHTIATLLKPLPIIMTSIAPVAHLRSILPSHGVARVKSILSGDTVILLGKATTPDGRSPEVVFTFEKVSAPRWVHCNIL